MKSKISLFNKAVWKRNVTGGWCLWAGLLLFYLLVLPVSLYGGMSQMLRDNVAESPSSGIYPYMMVETLWRMQFFVWVFAFAALLCAMHVFSYLFTARNSNMMHTYPVSRLSLFVTNYVSGLLFLLVPAVLAALLALAAGASLGVVTGEVVKYYMLWILTAAVENIFFFSMAVCVLMFVGNIIAVPVLYLILNFLYDGCRMILETILTSVCYGLASESIMGNGISVLTPIIYMGRVGVNYVTYEGTAINCTLNRMNALPGYFVAGIGFLLIALAAYGKKHIETAGDVITVNWMKPIFRWGAAVCTASLGAIFMTDILLYTNSFVMLVSSVALIGIAVFFIVQMLLERSVHVFTKKRIKECIVYSVIVCACYVALDMDVLGLERKIPPAGEVQAVQVRGSLEMVSAGQEEIDWVHGLHSQIIASRKEFKRLMEDDGQLRRSVSIEYLLKDGSTFRRSYHIPVADEIYEQVKEYASLPKVQLEQVFGIHYPAVEVYGGTWEYYNESGELIEKRIAETDAKKLCEALTEDINSGRLKEGLEVSVDYAENAQTVANLGTLRLEIRDEAGYFSNQNYRRLTDYNSMNLSKDGRSNVYVDERYASLVTQMRELDILK